MEKQRTGTYIRYGLAASLAIVGAYSCFEADRTIDKALDNHTVSLSESANYGLQVLGDTIKEKQLPESSLDRDLLIWLGIGIASGAGVAICLTQEVRTTR